MATIAVLAALDTKGEEAGFLASQIVELGHETWIADLGILKAPKLEADVSRHEIAAAAGAEIDELVAAGDRGRAVSAMASGIESVAREAFADGLFCGLIGLGGSAGTTMATAAMRALPLGVPKVMVSTMAGGDTAPYVGVKDVVMVPSIVDISGLNRISRTVLRQAAAAVCAMVEATAVSEATGKDRDRPTVVASMFGNTTECVEAARRQLEAAGYEVLIFHAVGSGGRTLETLVDGGFASGVLDVTTTEWADQLVGGVLAAGSERLEAAARTGTPAVVAPGCLDMVNFGPPDSVPTKFQGRLFYQHNPSVTLMRTTAEECRQLGQVLAEKLNASRGPVAVYLPLGGISVISAPGQPFYDPEADHALFSSLKQELRDDIPVHEIEANINEPAFSTAVSEGLLALMEGVPKSCGDALPAH